ncbi:MAG: hypothetical protein KME49_30265 [Brasilonema octagenarum HA4186-MV1]|jgi:hypothetical protein|nr:hypothetical protein [Brasilonema octagenarum HA4186-MV1]
MGESLVPYLAATSPVACFLNPLLSIIRGVRGASAQAKFPPKSSQRRAKSCLSPEQRLAEPVLPRVVPCGASTAGGFPDRGIWRRVKRVVEPAPCGEQRLAGVPPVVATGCRVPPEPGDWRATSPDRRSRAAGIGGATQTQRVSRQRDLALGFPQSLPLGLQPKRR